jgi:hypothetical protein
MGKTSTVWPNTYDKSGPIYLKEGRAVSSFMLELTPNICENLQFCMSFSTNIRWPSATDQLSDPRMALPNQRVQKSQPSRLD